MSRFSIPEVSAHCDLPCGIYETDTMRHAADTCVRMIEKIESLGELDSVEKYNSFVRAVNIKEIHAERCKHELCVLWGDYFKPEHLGRFPDLHETFWQTVKQASKVKQSVSRDEADRLVAMVANVAELFANSKH